MTLNIDTCKGGKICEKEFNEPNIFIDHSNDINEFYENIEVYNTKKVILSHDIIAN